MPYPIIDFKTKDDFLSFIKSFEHLKKELAEVYNKTSQLTYHIVNNRVETKPLQPIIFSSINNISLVNNDILFISNIGHRKVPLHVFISKEIQDSIYERNYLIIKNNIEKIQNDLYAKQEKINAATAVFYDYRSQIIDFIRDNGLPAIDITIDNNYKVKLKIDEKKTVDVYEIRTTPPIKFRYSGYDQNSGWYNTRYTRDNQQYKKLIREFMLKERKLKPYIF